MDKPDLLPCPICRASPNFSVDHHALSLTIECDSCGLKLEKHAPIFTPHWEEIVTEQIIIAWNTRTLIAEENEDD